MSRPIKRYWKITATLGDDDHSIVELFFGAPSKDAAESMLIDWMEFNLTEDVEDYTITETKPGDA